MSSVGFICGTQDIHKTLETKIAEFLGTEDAILYSSETFAQPAKNRQQRLCGAARKRVLQLF